MATATTATTVETRENLLGKYQEIVLSRANHASKQPANDDPKYQGWSERAEKWDATFVAWQEQWRDRQVHTLAELSGWLEDTIAIKARKWKDYLNDPDVEPSDIATETINWICQRAVELGAGRELLDQFTKQKLTPRDALEKYERLLAEIKYSVIHTEQTPLHLKDEETPIVDELSMEILKKLEKNDRHAMKTATISGLIGRDDKTIAARLPDLERYGFIARNGRKGTTITRKGVEYLGSALSGACNNSR